MDSSTAKFTDMEIDTIGEILNISMGSAATAVSTLLNKKVYITTPKVEVVDSSEYGFTSLTPAIGVEINYIEGLTGINVMILKETDVQKIIAIMLQTEYSPDEDFVMDELSESAICECMNQMMGSSSTALAQFLSRTINISTPTAFKIETDVDFGDRYFKVDEPIVTVKFNLTVEDVIDSEFASVIPVEFARELLDSLFASQNAGNLSPGATVPEQKPSNEPAIQAPPTERSPVEPPVKQNPPAQQQIRQNVQQFAKQQQQVAPDYNVTPSAFQGFNEEPMSIGVEKPENLKLIMSVPLKITVELGHSKKSIKDILEFTSGSIIELNRQAGMPVDILVNGQTIAKGDVVVVEEYYGVRITEILNPNEIMKVL